MISHGVWQRQFGRQPDVVGRSLVVEKVPFTIVGVMPDGFHGLQTGQRVDFAIPLASESLIRESTLKNLDYNWLSVVGRLKPGAGIEDVRANLDPVFTAVIEEFAATLENPEARARTRRHRLELTSARAGLADLRRGFSKPVLLLAGAVGVVLLIACANVVNLLLARHAARRREIALRLAIGASRGRLIRQLTAESLALGAIGGGLGLVVAFWCTPLLTNLISEVDSRLAFDVAPNLRVVAFTALVSIASALAAGLAPALRATKPDTSASYHGEGRTLHGSRGTLSWTRGVIAVQMALSVLLLAGAALLVTTLRNLTTMDAGFDRDRVLLVTMEPGRSGVTHERARVYYQQVLDRVRATPGVSAAALSWITPIAGGGMDLRIRVEGRETNPGAMVYVNSVGDGYFATMGTRLLAGREFTPKDGPGAPPVAIVNEAAARRYFDSADPIGRRLALGDRRVAGGGWLDIVGVVANAKYLTLREADQPTVYLAFQDSAPWWLTLCVRAHGDPAALGAAVLEEVRAIGPTVRLRSPQPLSFQVSRSLVTERLVARILGAFAALALILAAVGLYGVLGHAVTRRTPEIGLRIALGASRRAVVASVLRESTIMVAAGAAIGVAGALASTRLLSSLLYGVTPADPIAIAVALTALISVSLAAAAYPAWRASRVDPMIALRTE